MAASAAFIASDYCWEKEMTTALFRHESDEAKVVPIILHPCTWNFTPLKGLQAVPKDARAISLWSNKHAAMADVARQIGNLAKNLLSTSRAERAPKVAVATPISIGVDSNDLPDLNVFKDDDLPWLPAMVAIPAGSFWMGSPPEEEGRKVDEDPQHRVRISRRFAIGRYAVTFDEYDHFCEVVGREKLPDMGWGRGRRPVINVSWQDATDYVAWLSLETGQPYRLPTEAEWEYACRAGTITAFSVGMTISAELVNCNGAAKQTIPVGSLPPNQWGLHEMHGNVSEWCLDGGRSYTNKSVNDPLGPMDPGAMRVLRGGSWYDNTLIVRSACRYWFGPGYRSSYFGFHCARDLEA